MLHLSVILNIFERILKNSCQIADLFIVMKTLVQKLPLDKESSFIAQTFETPYFETPYHQHDEYELMVIKIGNGTAFVGDSIREYSVGDVYLHGSNLPHWFRKKNEKQIGASMVVQFKDDFLGEGFFDIP